MVCCRVIMDPQQWITLLAGSPFAVVVAAYLLWELPKLRRAVESGNDKLDHMTRLLEVQAGLRRRDEV